MWNGVLGKFAEGGGLRKRTMAHYVNKFSYSGKVANVLLTEFLNALAIICESHAKTILNLLFEPWLCPC